jgi:hypothetical protein
MRVFGDLFAERGNTDFKALGQVLQWDALTVGKSDAVLFLVVLRRIDLVLFEGHDTHEINVVSILALLGGS